MNAARTAGWIRTSVRHGWRMDRRGCRHLLARLCAVLMWASAVAAHAQYPDHTVRIVVPFSVGSGGDIAARIFAQKLGERWHQGVFVDNQVGANGIIGAHIVARAPADGYTLLVANDAVLTVNPAMYRKLPYNTLKDFAPIALFGETPMVLVASPAYPSHTLKDLLDAARKSPGTINFGSGGVGSAQYLPMEMLMADTKTKMTHIPFKAMSSALLAVVAGQIPVMFSGASAAQPYVQSGKLNVLAVGDAQRLADLPNVPTVAESGVPGFQYGTWLGIVAPAGTPPAVVAKINTDVAALLNTTDVKQHLLALGFLPAKPEPSQAFGKLIADDLQRFGALIKAAGIQADQ